jgi:hypothetical protein
VEYYDSEGDLMNLLNLSVAKPKVFRTQLACEMIGAKTKVGMLEELAALSNKKADVLKRFDM